VAVTSANSLSTKHVKDAELSSGVGTRAVEAESYDRMRPSRTFGRKRWAKAKLKERAARPVGVGGGSVPGRKRQTLILEASASLVRRAR
jgi:hypothetical protein